MEAARNHNTDSAVRTSATYRAIKSLEAARTLLEIAANSKFDIENPTIVAVLPAALKNIELADQLLDEHMVLGTEQANAIETALVATDRAIGPLRLLVTFIDQAAAWPDAGAVVCSSCEWVTVALTTMSDVKATSHSVSAAA